MRGSVFSENRHKRTIVWQVPLDARNDEWETKKVQDDNVVDFKWSDIPKNANKRTKYEKPKIRYTKLGDMKPNDHEGVDGKQLNFYGVVTEYSQPRQTKGKDWLTTITVSLRGPHIAFLLPKPSL